MWSNKKGWFRLYEKLILELIIETLTKDSSAFTNNTQELSRIFSPLEKTTGALIHANMTLKPPQYFHLPMDTPLDCYFKG